MTGKKFFKLFRWGVFCPAIICLVIGIMTAAMYPSFSGNTAAGYAYEFTVAALALIAGAIAVAYYFLGRNESVFYLLSAVGCVAMAVYLFVPTLVRWSVVPIALGVSLMLNGAAEGFEGFRARKAGGKAFLVRIAAGVILAVGGLFSCLRLFPALSSDWIFSGVAYLVGAVVTLAFGLTGGLFDEEETLKFRPVKKSAEDGTEAGPSREVEAAEEENPSRRGAHRK